MKTNSNRLRVVLLFYVLAFSGFVQGQQRSSAEQNAKQHVAEMEGIRERREAAARAAELAKLCSLKCEVNFRVALGDVKVGANSPVLLLRATDLSREAVQKAFKDDSLLTLRSYYDVQKQIKADAQGIAQFESLSEGNYLIVSEVRWLKKGFFKDKKFGGIVFCSVFLRPGQSASVVVTN